MGRYVAYYRVSTARQGRSGLGLEAQRHAVEGLARYRGWAQAGEFTEVESGKMNQRPELARALHLTRVTGATLVIAKLDRLSRNAAFLLGLQDARVPFICCDMPDANELTVGIMALVAQHDVRMTSARTREALAALKARGKRLGNPNGARALLAAGKGNVAALAAVRKGASDRARDVLPIIRDIQAGGVTSHAGIARELNLRMIRTPRRGNWTNVSVGRVLARDGVGGPDAAGPGAVP